MNLKLATDYDGQRAPAAGKVSQQEGALYLPHTGWACLPAQDRFHQCLLLQADYIWKEGGKMHLGRFDAIFSMSKEMTSKYQLSLR